MRHHSPVLSIAGKNLRILWRDPQLVVLLVIMPLLLIFLLSSAFERILGDSAIALPVVDLDGSPESGAFVGQLDNLGGIDTESRTVPGKTVSDDDARGFLDGGKYVALLVIPAGYSQAASAGEAVSLQLLFDPAQTNLASAVADQIDVLLVEKRIEFVAVQTAAEISSMEPSEIQALLERKLAAEDIGSVLIEKRPAGLKGDIGLPSAFDQTVPGLTVMFSFWIIGWIGGNVFAEREAWGTWRRVLSSPASPLAIFGGLVLAAMAIGFVQVMLLLVLGHFIFGMSLGSDVFALLLMVLALSLVPPSIGIFLVSITQTNQQLSALTNIIVLGLAAVSGAMIPLFLLPDVMQKLALFTPQHWALTGLQDIIARGGGISDVALNSAVLAAIATGFFLLGVWRLRPE